ncbi:carotenoid biosynthesis protein [Arsenicibacter rosenii]|uniref:Carotenoid biosynthesis protein n=1 Tax=Arsenicibacter rosenii TaxID=1750698 RepID=A0A1S2VBB6_9BACT|nr:carotenoid biosynthesis protein [Arsenicibacter rosenii]OIN56021.1 hypothetical protein BLX24_27120 [Arsenicibacter rosenii]
MFTAVPNTNRQHTLIVFLLVLSHLVGAVGLHLPMLAPLFKLLVPVNLAVSLALLLWYHTDWSASFKTYILIAILTGFFIEVIGVKTGLIFGHYAYGPVLGPHLWGVPPMIGFNWLMLSYCCGSVCSRIAFSDWTKAAVAASLMVLLDIFIEPVAIRLNFWHWYGQSVPLQNYVAWWIVSYFLFICWFRLSFTKNNRLAGWLLLSQFLFFISHILLILV